jgi:Transglutaminase-like superfamily
LQAKSGRASRNGSRGKGRGFGLSPEDVRTLRGLKTPALIQKFVDGLTYQYANTAWSPARVLRERKGHCLEGALVAAAALRVNGHPAQLMDLEGHQDDDHVVALYRERGLWGGIAKSNFAGLRFRAPIYRTLRELALSYFEHYYNLRGERTLRSYAGPVNLQRLDGEGWMTSEKNVWRVPELLIAARHYPLFPHRVARTLPRLDRRSFEAGMHGWVKH